MHANHTTSQEHPRQDAVAILDLLRGEPIEKPGLHAIVQLLSWAQMTEAPCRHALAWLLVASGLSEPVWQIARYAEELDRTLLETARYFDQLMLLLDRHDWERPSDVLGPLDRFQLVGLVEVATKRLGLDEPRNLRLAGVVHQLEVCLNRNVL